MPSLFDFEHQFLGYAEYHNNKINQAIHMVFVPTIMWTAMVWLHNLPPLLPTWSLQDSYTPFNLTFVFTCLYALYYIALSPKFGLSVSPILFFMNYSAYHFLHNDKLNAFNGTLGGVSPNVIASGIHIASWIFQFLGHGLAEKRRRMGSTAKAVMTVAVRTTGHEHNRFTVALTVASDGSKLKPLVIFKGSEKGNPAKQLRKHLERQPLPVVVKFQSKGYMDEDTMLDTYIDSGILFDDDVVSAENSTGGRTMLIMEGMDDARVYNAVANQRR
ncbi:hypothetical protein HDV05_002472 [Chytridiales sp. JEL 0842]|nr:hypothetical protein HDV05_002472 [Chytridiales sp. JEL 0842]